MVNDKLNTMTNNSQFTTNKSPLVKKGYKNTEIGVIPVEWEVVELGEKFTIKNGLNKAKEFFGYGTPIVNYMDIF